MAEMLCKEDLLKKIQEIEFALVELNLYLDSYPTNSKAVMDYNCYTEELTKLKKMYEREHGSLTNFGYAPSECPWQWVEEPWPWQIER